MNDHQDPKWIKGPRVRIETLKKGDCFMDVSGNRHTYNRIDDALSGVHHVVSDRLDRTGANERTAFAGCAEVIFIGRST